MPLPPLSCVCGECRTCRHRDYIRRKRAEQKENPAPKLDRTGWRDAERFAELDRLIAAAADEDKLESFNERTDSVRELASWGWADAAIAVAARTSVRRVREILKAA